MRIIYLEPFDSGSHAAFGRTLTAGIPADWTVLTLPGRHWKWRMRGAACWFALERGEALSRPHDLLLASSYLPLHELRGLAPALAHIPSIQYFHENQLAYPVRTEHAGERDLHFGFTQLVSAQVADACVFNSRHNRDSFLDAARELLRRLPDAVPRRMVERIAAKSSVLPVPLSFELLDPLPCTDVPAGPERADGPVLLWNHRWEHDKDPEAFFAALRRLVERQVPFRLIVCGQRFRDTPPVFAQARQWLGARVLHWGYATSAAAYAKLLGQAQLAVSTARHEFFGCALLEAVHAGARPLVPDRLAYPEHFPVEYRYTDEDALADELERLCRGWQAGQFDLRADRRALTAPYRAELVLPRFRELFAAVAAQPAGKEASRECRRS